MRCGSGPAGPEARAWGSLVGASSIVPSQHEHDDAKVAAVFVLEHGEAYGLDVTRGPTSEFIQTWGFHNRTMAFVSRPLRPL